MRNEYKFYVDIGRETIEFPVNPKEYTVSYQTDHKTYNVLDIGEIVVPRLPSLMEVSWESFFPGDPGEILLMGHGFEDPGYYVELIEDAMRDKRVCDLVISRYDANGSGMYDTNISVVITSFETTEKGGSAGDVYYKIKFTEYRDYGAVRVAMRRQEQPETAVQAYEEQRPAAPVLRVGASVTANGTYYSSSYGDRPTGTANNLQTTVSRIIPDPSRAYPVLIGGNRGWIKAEQLQVTG